MANREANGTDDLEHNQVGENDGVKANERSPNETSKLTIFNIAD